MALSYEQIRQKLRRKEFIVRCLKHSMCPDCGQDLEDTSLSRTGTMVCKTAMCVSYNKILIKQGRIEG